MTSQFKPSLLQRLIYNYKSLRLPWRRSTLRGYDLDGNTFWESYNPLTPQKYRRTVKYVVDGHYTDNSVTPQWMAWLRHTRPNPPSLGELQDEVVRIQQTRRNAVLVQQRWADERDRLIQAQSAAQQIEQPAVMADKSEHQVVQQQEEREKVLAESTQQQAEASGASRTTDGRKETQNKTNNNDYLSPPGERDEKGEWQPESWKPNPNRVARRS